MKKKNVEVSVIMAEYNTQEENLKKAINSILIQTYDEFEFIIVNDGSKTDLEKIVKEFNDNRIKIINNNGNKGFVYSLNTAIKHAKGKYLVRMDTDDISTSDRIEKQVDFMKKHPEYAVVSSKTIEFSGSEEMGLLGESGEKKKNDILKGNTPIHAASIFLKEAIDDVGGYKDFNRAEDFVLWCELLLKNYRLYVTNDMLYYYRVDPDDYKKRTLKNRKGEIIARLKYYPLLKAHPKYYLKILKSIIAGILPKNFVRKYRKKKVLTVRNK